MLNPFLKSAITYNGDVICIWAFLIFMTIFRSKGPKPKELEPWILPVSGLPLILMEVVLNRHIVLKAWTCLV